MNKNKLRSTIVTLVVATVLIGMTFGAMADPDNVPDAPEPRLTISTMNDGGYYMAGMGLSDGRQLNRIDQDTDLTHLELFERFPEYRDDDMPDWFIDSQMNRITSRRDAPDRFDHDRLAGDIAYQRVSDNDIPLVMSEATSSECSFTYGITAGDLNGDDKADVLVFSGTYNSTTYAYTFESVSAVNGDGAELWIQSIIYEAGCLEDIPAYPVGDLDGDNKDDVIVESRSYDTVADECTVSVYAKGGYDGHQFWNQSVTGDGEYGAYMWASAYCDLDGDNKDDVIVNSRSYNSSMDEYSTSVHAKRGYDGDQFWSCSVTGERASLWASSYCDLDGDNKDDALVNSWSYDSGTGKTTASVYAKRGYDGHQFWSQSVTGDGEHDTDILVSSYCDLDGDNKDDVVVESRNYDSVTDEYTASVYAMRGYDGHQFWSQSVTGDGEYGTGARIYLYCDLDLDGDNKDDVIVISESCDSTTEKRIANVYAKRGYDGYQFWNQSVTGESVSLLVSPYCDLDGDNKDDVIVESWSYNSSMGEYTTSVYAKRGYDGHQFWSQSVTGERVSLWASSYCDLDGDNKDDVIVDLWSYDSVTYEYSVYAKRGYDGDEFWNHGITGEDVWMRTDYCDWYYYSTQDFDGDNLGDILITTGIFIDCAGDIPTKVCAVKGNDGTSLWCKPSAPPVTGDLNGDGKLTPADAVIALNIAVSGDYNEYADVNDDGVVNSLDVLMVLQAAASSITI